jgi:spore coat polysaccharide biosynthesis predicted glycosyltransferase SpsG
MNRDPIFIRVDANPQSGYERFARSLILGAALQRRRRPVYFLSNLQPNGLALTIKRGGNEWISLDAPPGTPEHTAQVLREVHRLQPAALFIDDAEANSDNLDEMAQAVPLLVSMDHLGQHRTPARLVVNTLLGPSKETFEYAADAQLLFGRRYGMVRPDIRRHRPTRAQEPAPLPQVPGKGPSGQFRALVALGEDDPHGQTIELAKLLLAAPKIGRVDMVVRREHAQLDELKALVEANPERLELALEPAEITAKLVRCHFAVTSGSGWSLELACIGVPQLIVVQNEFHWPNAQRLEEEGCANVLGWQENTSAQTIRLAVQNLLADPLERQAMARCGRKLIDGRGPDRIVNAMEIMLAGALPSRRRLAA